MEKTNIIDSFEKLNESIARFSQIMAEIDNFLTNLENKEQNSIMKFSGGILQKRKMKVLSRVRKEYYEAATKAVREIGNTAVKIIEEANQTEE